MEEMKIDTAELQTKEVEVPTEPEVVRTRTTKMNNRRKVDDEIPIISCLRNERVTVKYIPKEKTGLLDPKHPYYGGLADNATITYTVPMLKNGTYCDPLTKVEKAFLEEYLGLEFGALSVYNHDNNFWDNFRVTLSKVDTILDLSDAHDYIKYKVLLCNKDYIADSLETLRETPYETFRFVIVSDNEVYSKTVDKTNTKSKCWKEFGKVEDNFDVLRCIVETLESKPIAPNTKIEFLRDRVDKLIEADGRRFLSVITDPLLSIKVLIKKAVDEGIIDRRGDWYFYNSSPLCGKNEDPTFTVAAKYLGAPKNQEIKFGIEAKLK